MIQDNSPINPEVIKRLEDLRRSPSRDPQSAALRRDQYLAQLNTLQTPVSLAEKLRLINNGLTKRINNVFQIPKERFMMTGFSMIMALIALMVGAAGGTVYASQASLPDAPLYPVKIASENVRVQFATQPAARLELMEQFTDRRMEEISAMLLQVEMPPEAVLLHLQEQIQMTLDLAASLDDAQLEPALLGMQDRLQERLMQMERLNECLQDETQTCTPQQLKDQARLQDKDQLQNQDQLKEQDQLQDCLDGESDCTPDQTRSQLQERDQLKDGTGSATALVNQVQTMLMAQLNLVEDGQMNKETFRNRVRTHSTREPEPTPVETQAPAPTQEPPAAQPIKETPQAEETSAPKGQNGNQPLSKITPDIKSPPAQFEPGSNPGYGNDSEDQGNGANGSDNQGTEENGNGNQGGEGQGGESQGNGNGNDNGNGQGK